MTTQIPSRLTVVIALLITALIVLGLSLFTFSRIDSLVHNDLYYYGLQFDNAWAKPYWDNSGLLIASITIAIFLIASIIPLILLFTRKNPASPLRYIVYVLPFAAAGFAVFSAAAFNQINNVIHTDFYSYGLQPSLNWGLPLQTYLILSYALLGAAVAIVTLVEMLFLFGTQEKVTGNQEYTKKTLLSAIAYPEMETLNRIILGMGFKGVPVYLPPKYFTNPETCKAYIPKHNKAAIPILERIKSQESHLFVDAISAMLVTPPGAELAKLFEKTLGASFSSTNLQFLRQNLPKLIVNKLEIAQNFEMDVENGKIQVKILNSVYNRSSIEKKQQGLPFGSILSSAVACALAKTTGNPIIIESQQISPDGEIENLVYRVAVTDTRKIVSTENT